MSCEREVFEAVIRWVHYDIDQRCQKLDILLSSVRCHYLSPRYLTRQIDSCPIIQRVPLCAILLRRIVEELTEHQCCRERRRRSSKQAIYIIGGYLRHSLTAVECWSPRSKKWYRLASLTVPRSGIAACQVCLIFVKLTLAVRSHIFLYHSSGIQAHVSSWSMIYETIYGC